MGFVASAMRDELVTLLDGPKQNRELIFTGMKSERPLLNLVCLEAKLAEAALVRQLLMEVVVPITPRQRGQRFEA